MIFIAAKIGSKDMSEHIESVKGQAGRETLSALRHAVLWEENIGSSSLLVQSYEQFLNSGSATPVSRLRSVEASVQPHDLLNIQFTSGTPRAARGLAQQD